MTDWDAYHLALTRKMLRSAVRRMPGYKLAKDGRSVYWTGPDGKRKEPA